MHEIGVYGSCGSQVTVVSPNEAAFDLYAIKNDRSLGSCPSDEDIMTHYDRVAYNSQGTVTMYLDEGLWCVVVSARSGSGTAYVTADSNCVPPGPTPTPIVPYPALCSPYKSVDRSGYLYQGQAAVYAYYIPDDGRSLIDWTVTGSGFCEESPIIMSRSVDQNIRQDIFETRSDCGDIFDVYAFKECNPQDSYCSTNYHARGPDVFVSIASPQRGSTYYVMVYAHRDSGAYNLRMNSYTCYFDIPISIAEVPDVTVSTETIYTWAEDVPKIESTYENSVSAPNAEFIPVSSP
ncbi:hypothetical protein [uncultured Methanospirillum sp.]|uniref:hypothetical protein n=1 Tax=uncultured Methanospirillum sp. TaxID=262503 RepID=UPI0029C80209|nr:hypothetical protein [uncultured Methanospirillum sp.]